MAQRDKRFEAINKRPYRTDVTFSELNCVLIDFGFKQIGATGSHFKYKHPLLNDHIIIVKNNGRHVKAIYVKVAIEAIEEVISLL